MSGWLQATDRNGVPIYVRKDDVVAVFVAQFLEEDGKPARGAPWWVLVETPRRTVCFSEHKTQAQAERSLPAVIKVVSDG